MSEDYQWRQLGSIANKVLMDTRTKAVRKGIQAKVSPPQSPAKTRQRPTASMPGKLGHGFLNPDYQPAPPAQLELPFGIAAPTDSGKIRSPKGARLM